LDFSPQKGREQADRRPAVVLSPAAYNGKVGLAVVCPVTNQVKGYPFEVRLPKGCGITGVVLADQVKSLDWRARRAERRGIVPDAVLRRVVDFVNALIDPDGEAVPEGEER